MNNGKLVYWILGALFALFTIVSSWAYNGMDSRLRATEERVDALMEGVSKIQSDVSYIRGRLEPR